MVQLALASTGKTLRALGSVRYGVQLPRAKLSMALLSSSTNGSESNSSMVGKHSVTSRAPRDTVFSLE